MKIDYTLLLFIVSYAIQAGEPPIIELTQEQKDRVAQGNRQNLVLNEEQSQRLIQMGRPTFNGRYLYDAQPNEETSDTGLSSNNNVQIGDDENVPESTFSKIWSSGKRLMDKACTMTNAYRCSTVAFAALGIAMLFQRSLDDTQLQVAASEALVYIPTVLLFTEMGRLILFYKREKNKEEEETLRLVQQAVDVFQEDMRRTSMIRTKLEDA